MPMETFKIAVVNKRQGEPENIVVADAMQYLAYADQTDTVGYHGRVDNVDVDLARVRFTISEPIPSDDELKRFMDEMATLSRVERVERVGVME